MLRRLQHELALIAYFFTALAVLGSGCRQPPKKQVSIVDGVEVIVNPASPLHPDPGRVLKVEERLRIRDVGDRFFFKYPARPEIAPDGSIFLIDQDQLLKFSPAGAFLGNFCKPGQGPGEIQGLSRYVLEPDGIYAAGWAVNKLVHMTLDGRYLDDRRNEDYSFETMTRSWIVGLRINLPKVNGVFADAKYNFFCTSRSDESLRKTYAFLGKWYRNPGVSIDWDRLTWVADAARDLLFISLSRDYEIKLLDLDQGRIVRTFRRDYPKVAFVPPEKMKAVYEKGGTPKPEYERDILELFLPDSSIWVRTSTVEAGKGQLFDVFSAEGDFLDSFFIPVKGKILGIRGETVFVQETAEDGTIAVVLYRNLEYRTD
jgi:hypothetical protein